jgi:hypothetical protein
VEDNDMKDLIEIRIINAVRNLFDGRVNELLRGKNYTIPLIEFGNYLGVNVVNPVINLSTCERTEKERVIRQDAYSITVSISFPDTPESELYCYVYSGIIGNALYENPTLDGVVDRAVITGKKYNFSKKHNINDDNTLVVTLRLTVGATI